MYAEDGGKLLVRAVELGPAADFQVAVRADRAADLPAASPAGLQVASDPAALAPAAG